MLQAGLSLSGILKDNNKGMFAGGGYSRVISIPKVILAPKLICVLPIAADFGRWGEKTIAFVDRVIIRR